jgi:hypothetical protein
MVPVFALEMELKPPLSYDDNANSYTLELDVFGLSYHDNRSYDFNEVNPGVGLNLCIKASSDDVLELMLSGACYKDSYSDLATFVGIGPRWTVGDRKSLHASLAFIGGYMMAEKDRTLAVPVLAFGYDFVDVCFTGKPSSGDEKYADASNMVAVFLKFRVWEF